MSDVTSFMSKAGEQDICIPVLENFESVNRRTSVRKLWEVVNKLQEAPRK